MTSALGQTKSRRGLCDGGVSWGGLPGCPLSKDWGVPAGRAPLRPGSSELLRPRPGDDDAEMTPFQPVLAGRSPLGWGREL